MPLRLLISLSLLLLAWQKAGAQLAPAADFFNSGAQFYISNNLPAALERADSGLKLYPDDIKLKKLDELLNQQQQQQQQNQQNQQSKQDQKQDQQKQDEQKNQQSKDQAKQDLQQKEDKQQAAAESQEMKDRTDAGEAATAAASGQMTAQQARQLLEALKGQEQLLWFKPADNKAPGRNRPFKDW